MSSEENTELKERYAREGFSDTSLRKKSSGRSAEPAGKNFREAAEFFRAMETIKREMEEAAGQVGGVSNPAWAGAARWRAFSRRGGAFRSAPSRHLRPSSRARLGNPAYFVRCDFTAMGLPYLLCPCVFAPLRFNSCFPFWACFFGGSQGSAQPRGLKNATPWAWVHQHP